MVKEYDSQYIPGVKLTAVSERLLALEKDTRDFLIGCIQHGALNALPELLTDDEWNENLHFLFRYMMGDESKQQIGEPFGLNKYRTTKKLRRTIELLWQNLPIDARDAYDPQKISFKKTELERTKNIYQEIQSEGEKSSASENILERLGISNKTLSQRRGVLRKKYEIEPETLYGRSKFKNSQIAAELKRAADDETIQSLLDMVNRGFYKRFVYNSEEEVILPISQCIPSEFHFSRNDMIQFINAILASDIPVGQIKVFVNGGEQKGIQYYFFVAAQHEERVQQFLLHEPKLAKFKRNPVQQYSGPPQEKLPTTTLLTNKIGYQTLPHLYRTYKDLLHEHYSFDVAKKIFTADCPVPIFRIGNLLYYSLEQEEQLLKYLTR
jgi:hypothetical protein